MALVNLDSRPRPAGAMPVVLAPGDSGILLHEAVGHGLEADFNRKRTSNYTDRIGKPGRLSPGARWSMTRPSTSSRQPQRR